MILALLFATLAQAAFTCVNPQGVVLTIHLPFECKTHFNGCSMASHAPPDCQSPEGGAFAFSENGDGAIDSSYTSGRKSAEPAADGGESRAMKPRSFAGADLPGNEGVSRDFSLKTPQAPQSYEDPALLLGGGGGDGSSFNQVGPQEGSPAQLAAEAAGTFQVKPVNSLASRAMLAAAAAESATAQSQAVALKELLSVKRQQNQAAAAAFKPSTASIAGLAAGVNNAPNQATYQPSSTKSPGLSVAEGERKSSATLPEENLAKNLEREELSAEEKAYEYDVRGRRKVSRIPASLEKKSEPGKPNTMEDPWLAFLSKTSSNALLTQIRGNDSLRDRLRQRLEELKNTPNSEDKVGFLEELLEQAAEPAAGEELSKLEPLTEREAFAMDQEETNAEIRRFLAELYDPADSQFLSTETLFVRISSMHRRQLIQGGLKLKP